MKKIQSGFPMLKTGRLVYLDSAATALKPQPVIDAINGYYSNYSSNVFRGLYEISQKATAEYESAREKAAQFINAKSTKEIIFTRGTTESINFIAYAWGRLNINSNDEIVTTIMEHHSNFVPWQELCRETGAALKVIDITDEGYLNLNISDKVRPFRSERSDLAGIVTKKTKLIAITHVSNVLGTINPIKELVKEVKRINPKCLVLVDGAQSVPHMNVDVQDLGCDFFVFSGHKMMGPTGIGVLWMKEKIAQEMPPFHFGGSMIEKVTLKETRYAPIPQKFEAGTPHIAGAIGLGAAIDYMKKIGIGEIRKHEMELTRYALQHFNTLMYCSIYGIKDVRHLEKRGGVISFNIFDSEKKLIHPHDVGDILGHENICVRVGHHCTMPLAQRLGIPASVRVSLHIYNDKKDIDRLIKGLEKVREIFH